MADKSWKQFERDVATTFGVMRKPGSGSMGRHDQTKADMYHPEIFAEMKHRKVYESLARRLAQTRLEAGREGRTGVLLFPDSAVDLRDKTIAVFISDLPALAAAINVVMLTPVEYFSAFAGAVKVDIPTQLRKSFSDLDEAIIMGYEENKPLAMLACRAPGRQGFIIVARIKNICEIANWCEAGKRYVGGRLGTLAYEDPPALVADKIKSLSAYEHHWQIPKPKKPRRQKPGDRLPSLPPPEEPNGPATSTETSKPE